MRLRGERWAAYLGQLITRQGGPAPIVAHRYFGDHSENLCPKRMNNTGLDCLFLPELQHLPLT